MVDLLCCYWIGSGLECLVPCTKFFHLTIVGAVTNLFFVKLAYNKKLRRVVQKMYYVCIGDLNNFLDGYVFFL